ncbi:hypothetical protein TrRE_jg4710 [Triparma retinervis]|uniref:Uncharacterized protein n=1 Tax=Triparma retinervis TaxID=2557542 RepID=A0A9W7ECY4_9STRA|nr:hypothetical protein TrRE_jg4710 [Triparma retinervis]
MFNVVSYSRARSNSSHPQILSPAELDRMEHLEKEHIRKRGEEGQEEGGGGGGECMCMFCLEEEQEDHGGTRTTAEPAPQDWRDEVAFVSSCVCTRCGNKMGGTNEREKGAVES